MTDPTIDPIRLTEAQWKVLHRLASDMPIIYIAPITRKWLLRAGYIFKRLDEERRSRMWAITVEGRHALNNSIKAWVKPS